MPIFQFLIGRLATVYPYGYFPKAKFFQFLIGRLATSVSSVLYLELFNFNSL